MWTIDKDVNVEAEKEFLALILNKPELIEITQIKPNYLRRDELSKLYDYVLDCYKKYKTINPVKIVEEHNDFDSKLYVDLLVNTFNIISNWKEQYEILEKEIIKNYKEYLLFQLNLKYTNKKISYEEFIKQIKKLDEIVLIPMTCTLTANEILENIKEENTRIIIKNFPCLNDKLKLVQGDFLIVGATTGAGKSGFLLNIMNSLMDQYQCIYFNMEMSKSTIYKRIVSIKSDIPISYINNPTEYQQQIITDKIQEIENNNIIVEHKANNIKSIKNILIKSKDKNKHTIVFIDHLGLTKVDEKKTLYEQTTEVAKELRQICLEYNCTIIGASQLNRGAYNSEEITLSMLKDSGELENSASKVILLYRDKNCKVDDRECVMNIEIAKNRDGITGILRMNYNKTKQIFKEL